MICSVIVSLIVSTANDTLVADNVFDNNTLRLYVVAYMDPAATVASGHTINFDLEYGDVTPVSTNMVLTTVDATVNNDTSVSIYPFFLLSLVELTWTNSSLNVIRTVHSGITSSFGQAHFMTPSLKLPDFPKICILYSSVVLSDYEDCETYFL